jgi:glucose-1-phosphate thymidylyltransferase
MKALVLAAGYGTRLSALTKDTPKPLLEVQGKSLVNYLLDKIRDLESLDEVIVVTNNKFYDAFCDWAKRQDDFPSPIQVVNDGTNTPEDRLGSIGDIDFVLNHKRIDDDLIVLGGDNLFDYDLGAYIQYAQKRQDAVTIGLYDIADYEQAKLFGVVAVDDNQKVIRFEEKPAQPSSTLVAMCFYYLPRRTLPLVRKYLDEVQKSDTAGDYIRWLCAQNEVYGYTFTGTWYDIGSIESYKEAQEKFQP